jgi:F-type H+-transporting ATPase subunit epsilon
MRPTCFAGWLTMSTWRNVGITYLKYADICATHVRNVLKEPAKTKAKSSSNMHARIVQWEAGKRGDPRKLRLSPLRIAFPPLP